MRNLGYILMALPLVALLAVVISITPREELENMAICFALSGLALGCVCLGYKFITEPRP